MKLLRLVASMALVLAARTAAGGPDTQWFRDAKFGIFMHWGLYSQLGNEWNGKSYYGSGEWLMNRAKIPADQYARIAEAFNPTNFHAEEWARLVKDSGARYLVITAKHHEGFAMFGSKASPFNIVDATPYHHDPMKDLASACRRDGLRFGFYYSQFLDWHEPNGGGNTWDFRKQAKNYQTYYADKSIPQIKELLSNYGPLDIIWFDMPGGLNRDETLAFMEDVRRLQPGCLISSRVGHDLGDFRDFGDSELPPHTTDGPWEALFTHNDSWGYARNDLDFKTPREIVRLLASIAARGGNLILNVGPDGTGRIPELSQRYLRDVGQWLRLYGDSIYGTTQSPMPDQPWGVATLKTNRLYLHVFERPRNGLLIVPQFEAAPLSATLVANGQKLPAARNGEDLTVTLPPELPDNRDTVVAVDFKGSLPDAWNTAPEIISRQFDSIMVDAAKARVTGRATISSITSSRYFGNWKHDVCAQNMRAPGDHAEFSCRFLEPGDYRIALEYACPSADKAREGGIEIGGQSLAFETLLTGEATAHDPLLFVRHNIGIVTVHAPETISVSIHPKNDGAELFRLRRLIFEPCN
ncbi:MAG TPA: alpha-L-fucosidase [Candidatus Saccharimonadales bacterium]|nr:alpha-L-fucosidase [Candidatus Saccharimonadales bacterium]